MSETVFLAGAGGAIGRQLVPLLIGADYRVFGTTRSSERAGTLEKLGVEPVILDVFGVSAVDAAFQRIRPDILVHMLTDLPRDLSPEAMIEGKHRNARIWCEATPNLMGAAKAAGTRLAIAQSLAWLYAPGPEPHEEGDPLGVTEPDLKIALDAITVLEDRVLNTQPIEGTVLRFGLLYGPGTSSETPNGSCTLHVEAAAYAALRSIESGERGVFNIVDDNGPVANRKARDTLGWYPEFRSVQC